MFYSSAHLPLWATGTQSYQGHLGRQAQGLGYQFNSWDILRASCRWEVIFQHFCLHWWQLPRLKATGVGSWESSLLCMPGMCIFLPSFSASAPEICWGQSYPWSTWKMSAAYSTIFSVFSKYTTWQWYSLPLSSQLTYYYFNCIPFDADTHSLFQCSLWASPTFHEQCELLRTGLRIYLSSLLATLPRTSDLQKLNLKWNLTFRSGTSDLGYSTLLFLAGSSALT